MSNNTRKREVMVCRNTGAERVGIVNKRGEELTQVEKLKYLDSVLKEQGDCEAEVQDRVKAAWIRWKEVSGGVYDRIAGKNL